MGQEIVRCVLAPGQRAELTFVVGRGFLAAVPVGASASLIEKLSAQTAEPSVQLETLVALMPLAGEHKIESFIIVVPGTADDDDGVPVSIVVRGEIAAEIYSVGGSRRFSDRDIRPWHLADFQAVVGIDIVLAGAPESMSPADRRVRGVPFGRGTVSGTSLIWSYDSGQVESADAALASHLPTAQLQMAAALPPLAPGHWFGLRLPGGDERRIDSVFLLGRRPRQLNRRDQSFALVPLASPTSAVSATHLEIRLDGANVLVTDLNSTNGTTLTFPDGRSERMRPGVAAAAAPGTSIDVGDGNIIEILPASER
jgi:hypothetical protein